MSQPYITKHAYERGKERLSLTKKAFEKISNKAYVQGISHSDTKGQLKKYVDKIYLEYNSANNVKIYGENVFLFHEDTLITVYQLPNEFKNVVKKIKCE